MGAVDCPVCEVTRHIDDSGDTDRCWACGWAVPVDKRTGEYLPKSAWPPVGEQERRDRRLCAERRMGRA